MKNIMKEIRLDKNMIADKKIKKNKNFKFIFLFIALFIIAFWFLITSSNPENTNTTENSKNKSEDAYNGPRKVVETEFLDEAWPQNYSILAKGEFKNVEQAVTGQASFVSYSEGIMLRFTNFETINGQDLHVYLSPVLNINRDNVIDLGLLKATSGNFNYQLAKDVDLDKYNNVIIWSDPFDAFFAYASLSPDFLDTENQESATSTPELY